MIRRASSKVLKHVLPDTRFLETAKEPFHDPVPFRRIRCDEFLLQPIVSTGLPESATLEDQSVVAAQERGTYGAERSETLEAGCFYGPLRLLRSTAQRDL